MEPMPVGAPQAIKPQADRELELGNPPKTPPAAAAAMSKSNDSHGAQMARANVLEQLTRDTHMAIEVMNYHSDLTFRFVEEDVKGQLYATLDAMCKEMDEAFFADEQAFQDRYAAIMAEIQAKLVAIAGHQEAINALRARITSWLASWQPYMPMPEIHLQAPGADEPAHPEADNGFAAKQDDHGAA